MELPWPKVQRRIAQLIQEDRFYTQAEQGALDDIDPVAIQESLAERGIVDGQVVDAQKLDNDPFIQRVMADVEQIAAGEETPEPRFCYNNQRRIPRPGGCVCYWDQTIHNYYASGDGTVPAFPDKAARAELSQSSDTPNA